MSKALVSALVILVLAAGAAVSVRAYKGVYWGVSNDKAYPYAGSGGCTGTGCSSGAAPGGCCGGGAGGPSAASLDEARRLAAEYYSSRYGSTGFSVEVKDFGCHQEAYVTEGGKVVKRLSISGGRVYETG